MTDTEYLQFQDDFYNLLEKYGVKQVDCEHPHWDAICKERNNTMELIDKLKEVAL